MFLKCNLLLLPFGIVKIAGSFPKQNNWWRSGRSTDERRSKQFRHSMFLDLSFLFFAFCSGLLSRRSGACPYRLEATNPQQNKTDIVTLSTVEDSFHCT